MKSSHVSKFLISGVLLFLIVLAGCDTGAKKAIDTGYGGLKGIVTNTDGEVVPDAFCVLSTKGQSREVHNSFTDAGGVFEFKSVIAGTSWSLEISKEGYQTIVVNVSVSSDTTTEVPGDLTVLTPITGASSVQGNVTDSQVLTPIPGASVSITDSQGDTQYTTTDGEGNYSFDDVLPGDYVIIASQDGYEESRVYVTVVEGGTTTENIAMDPIDPDPGKGHVTGKVVDEGQNPLAGVRVSDGVVTTTTDETGRYLLENLTPGKDTIYFDKEGYESEIVNLTVQPDLITIAETVVMKLSSGTLDAILCSLPRTTEDAGRFSDNAVCSDDGSIVVFISSQQLLPTHITNGSHAYMFSRSPGTVTLIDVNEDGLEGTLNGGAAACNDAFCSGDGTLTCFSTNADNLLGSGNDSNGASDVFVCDRESGEICRASVDYSNPLIGGFRDNARTIGGNSRNARLSEDGSHIVFESQARNIVAPGFITDGAANHATWNIFQVGLNPGFDGITPESPLLISGRQVDGKECDPAHWRGAGFERISLNPWMTRDGRFVIYESNALPGAAYVGGAGDSLINPNAGYRDGAADRDIILCDTSATIQTRSSFISENETGVRQAAGANPCTFPTVSDDGTLVLFRCADNLSAWVNGNDNFTDVWLKNTGDGSLLRISDAGSGTRNNSLTGMISRDGNWAVFSSAGTGFVQNDTNNSSDCFVYNVSDGTYQRVNLNVNNEQTENTGGIGSLGPFISGNNSYITFTSIAKNLVSNVYFTGGTPDVYLKRWR